MLRRTFALETDRALRDGAAARRARLELASPKPAVRFVTTRVFVRNPDVVAEVQHRAQGRCERCYSEAPFNSRATGKPYLEVHHRIPLADNGDDTVENAIALCPNCHRYCHHG
jgi:predicted HNH restriction endonuclease